MTFLSKIHKTTLGAVALGAALALAPMHADALTIRLTEVIGGVDGATTTESSAMGSVSVAAGTVGDFSFSLFGSSATDMSNTSRLASIGLDVSGGSLNSILRVEVSETGYSAAAGAPQISGVRFRINGAALGEGVTARSFVDNTNVLFGEGVQIGADMSFTNPDEVDPFGWGDQVQISTALDNPFSITQIIEITGGGKNPTQFDARTVAAIPLPAGGVLLLTALGGLAVMRRKRKAA